MQQMDGVELPARAWERDVLPSRIAGYTPAPSVTFNFLRSTGARAGTFGSTITPTLPSGTATVAYIPNGADLVVS